MSDSDNFKTVPVPKARADDLSTAIFYADADRKGLHTCRSTPKSSKS